jgi:hypothetical protein
MSTVQATTEFVINWKEVVLIMSQIGVILATVKYVIKG